MLPAAIGVALSPLPIVAVVLMLVTPKGRVNGPAFIIGWWAGLAIVGAIALSAAGAGSEAVGRPSSSGRGAATPKWMGALDGFTPLKAVGAGALLSGLNPKNLLLAVAGAAAIAGTGISSSQQAIAWVVFILIASIGVGAPVVIFFAMGSRSRDLLDHLKGWMAHNNAVIMAVLLLVIGVKLIGNAISGFSS
jgi:threonine/homoserine/homoserine lactone efflux protein